MENNAQLAFVLSVCLLSVLLTSHDRVFVYTLVTFREYLQLYRLLLRQPEFIIPSNPAKAAVSCQSAALLKV